MTDAELLRAMAQWYREGRTFTPELVFNDSCGCFLNAALKGESMDKGLEFLADVVGTDSIFAASDLIAAGWTGPECTEDAIAALEIAADLAEPSP